MSNKENKVHYDLDNVYFAPLDIVDGVAAFGKPVREHGAMSMDLSPKGDNVTVRADAMDYYNAVSNNGYDGSINFVQISDAFKMAHLGYRKTETGVLIEDANAEHKPFAMLYEFKGDKKHRRHVLYHGMANRPNEKGENKDSQKSPDTESLPVKFSPLPGGRVKSSTTADTTDEIYSKWFDAVWEETAAEPAAAAQTTQNTQT